MNKSIKELEGSIKYSFKNKDLLHKALTHKSFNSDNNNEKLEFLGGRVLGLIISKKLGFKHFIIDYQKEFEKSVIDNFVNSYKSGQTPIPCIKCNQTVKFRDLLNFTHSMNCNYLATGHYVK